MIYCFVGITGLKLDLLAASLLREMFQERGAWVEIEHWDRQSHSTMIGCSAPREPERKSAQLPPVHGCAECSWQWEDADIIYALRKAFKETNKIIDEMYHKETVGRYDQGIRSNKEYKLLRGLVDAKQSDPKSNQDKLVFYASHEACTDRKKRMMDKLPTEIQDLMKKGGERSDEDHERIRRAVDKTRVEEMHTLLKSFQRNYEPFDVIPFFRKRGWKQIFHALDSNQLCIDIPSLTYPRSNELIPDFWGSFKPKSSGIQGRGNIVCSTVGELAYPIYCWVKLRNQQLIDSGSSPRRTWGAQLDIRLKDPWDLRPGEDDWRPTKQPEKSTDAPEKPREPETGKLPVNLFVYQVQDQCVGFTIGHFTGGQSSASKTDIPDVIADDIEVVNVTREELKDSPLATRKGGQQRVHGASK